MDRQLLRRPAEIFGEWFAEARRANPDNADAAALATVGADGGAQLRTVLVKSFSPDAVFCFYTNRESRKARALAACPQAALLWYWREIRRQVSVEGEVAAMAASEAEAYFASRLRASQIGAWASRQSAPLESPALLAERVREAEARFAAAAVPLPPHWGGYKLIARRVEFWRQGDARLHSRLEFSRAAADAPWRSRLLFP